LVAAVTRIKSLAVSEQGRRENTLRVARDDPQVMQHDRLSGRADEELAM